MITQEDIDAAKSILWVSTIIDDQNAIAETFAAHRTAAEQRGMERAAVIADERAKASQLTIAHTPDRDKSYSRGSLIAAEQIAAAIRNIKEV